MYPYPPYLQDFGVGMTLGVTLPLFLVISFVLMVPSLIRGIVKEKATGVRVGEYHYNNIV